MLNFLSHVRIWLILTVWDIYASQLLSGHYVLFLVTVAMFFDGSNILTTVLSKTPLRTIIPSLVPFHQVVPEEKKSEIFFYDDGKRKVEAISHLDQREPPRLTWTGVLKKRELNESGYSGKAIGQLTKNSA